MVTRVSAPVTGASRSGTYLEDGTWQASLVYRHLDAKRHFRDNNEEVIPPGPRVILQTFDFSLTRAISDREQLSLSIPLVQGDFIRNFPLGGPNAKSISETNGIGDIAVTWRRWMRDPAQCDGKTNYRLALGFKAPTGDYNQRNGRPVNLGSPARPNVQIRDGHADAAIQPGDGGWGLIVGTDGFYRTGERSSLYWDFTYLMNPLGHNDMNNQEFGPGPYVPTTITSVPDYYLVRGGFAFPDIFDIGGLTAAIGLRLEGQPVHDVIGDASGFRRPGYTLAYDPGIFYTRGKSTIFVSLPQTMERVRYRSTDEIRVGRPNAVSAAFADHNVLAGYTYTF